MSGQDGHLTRGAPRGASNNALVQTSAPTLFRVKRNDYACLRWGQFMVLSLEKRNITEWDW